jgi:hypothetical protein
MYFNTSHAMVSRFSYRIFSGYLGGKWRAFP